MNEGAAKTLSGAPGNFSENGRSCDLKMGGLGHSRQKLSKGLPWDMLINREISMVLTEKLKTNLEI